MVAAKERKELNSSRKTEKGFENVEDEGGRLILNILYYILYYILISHPAEGRRLSWPEHTVG